MATRIPLPVEFYDPDTGKTLAAITVGSVEGSNHPTLWMGGGDIVNLRNSQLGFMGTSPGGDISAGGDGSTDNPRMWLTLQHDNGHGTVLADGRKRMIARFAGNDDEAKNLITLRAPTRLGHPYLYVPNGTGGWRKVKL